MFKAVCSISSITIFAIIGEKRIVHWTTKNLFINDVTVYDKKQNFLKLHFQINLFKYFD